MEEEKIVKKEENYSSEEYQKLKRKSEREKSVIVILLFTMALIVMLLGIYILNGSQKPDEGGPTPTPTPTEENTVFDSADMEYSDLTNKNMAIKLKSGTINVKASDGSVFVNDQKAYTSDGVGDGSLYYGIYTNEKLDYALITEYHEGGCITDISGAVISSGKYVDVNYNYIGAVNENTNCLDHIYIKEGKTLGKYYGTTETGAEYEYDIEFSLSE